MVEAFPSRHLSKLLAVSVDFIPVVLTATSINIHISGAYPALSLPCEASSPEHQNNGKRQIGVEKALSVADPRSNWRNSHVELEEVVSKVQVQ
jgi:hypothetical protein